jgi:hypothetical protein
MVTIAAIAFHGNENLQGVAIIAKPRFNCADAKPVKNAKLRVASSNLVARSNQIKGLGPNLEAPRSADFAS